ncbi:MAG TPA: hypothetical protein VIH53_02530 [Gemmatimonadaceae bacterium]
MREPSRVTGAGLTKGWGRALNLRSWSLMKGIQSLSLRWLSMFALVAVAGCGNERERDLVRADGEIFESVARAQLGDPSDTVASVVSPLRIDARPAGDNTELAATPDHPQRLEVGEQPDSVSTGSTETIVEQRRDILKALHIEEGGPFDYPECGGARARLSRDTTVVLPPPKCPPQVTRYITVGLPFRGASPILDKVRPPELPAPDSTAELWTVLMTESSVGPGGQQWRKYASLFKRDPQSGRLEMAERFLLSWAE